MATGKDKWSERFDRPVDETMESFNASVGFDMRLLGQEIRASGAHARMLGGAGIITAEDQKVIEEGLGRLEEQRREGSFKWDLSDEDVHTAVEKRLTEDIGDAGKRLHTARSRNDQVSTVLRMWLRDEIDGQSELLRRCRAALLAKAREHLGTVMPGFTHLQVAQPTTVAHHLHAHACMLRRDSARLARCRQGANILPLGAAAVAGTSFAVDPRAVAEELGFDDVCPNTMDAVADRDFVIDYLAAAATVMVHLSRLAEEIVVWGSQPFGFARVADGFSTGSSIMPQKRNPDAAELVRGKTGRVVGHLMGTLTMLKGLPLAYNKDCQEDKEPLFDAADTVSACLAVTAPMVAGLEFDKQALRDAAEKGYATATDLADLLVREGVPFRDAHSKVAAAVNAAEKLGVPLSGLPDEVLMRTTGLGREKALEALDVDKAVMARKGIGAPSPQTLVNQLDEDLRELGD